MPEEHNRVLTDHAADLLLAPTQVAVDHLANEGLADKTVLVGDVMTDVLYQVRALLASRKEPLPLDVAPQGYYVSTIHRPDNTDSPSRLKSILASLASLDRPVLLLAHPRLVSFAERHGLALEQGEHPGMPAAGLSAAGQRRRQQRRRHHRLGRPAEGSLPAAGTVHDASVLRPSGLKPSNRGGTSW